MKLFKVCLLTLFTCLSSYSHGNDIILYDFRGECAREEQLSMRENQSGTFIIPPNTEDRRVEEPDNAEAKALHAYNVLKDTLNYFKNQFLWNSIDNTGRPIPLFANFYLYDGEQCQGLNAFYMRMGDLRSISILGTHPDWPYGVSHDIDVVAHEFFHGVYNETIGPDLNTEMAAINESTADMFAIGFKLSDFGNPQNDYSKLDFFVGKNFAYASSTLLGIQYTDGVLRNLAHPARRGALDHYCREDPKLSAMKANREIYDIGAIISLAFVLMANGGTHPRIDNNYEVKKIGLEKSLEIFFYVFRHRLPFNNLESFSLRVIQASRKIYGEGSEEHLATQTAFAAVGLLEAGVYSPGSSGYDSAACSSSFASSSSQLPVPPNTTSQPPLRSLPASHENTGNIPSVDSPPNQESQPQGTQPTDSTVDEVPTVTAGQDNSSGLFFLIGFLFAMIILIALIFLVRRRVVFHDIRETSQVYLDFSLIDSQKKNFYYPHQHQKNSNSEISVLIEAPLQSIYALIGKSPLSLGRACGPIYFDDDSVSRHHCDIWHDAGKLIYIKNHSINDLKANGKSVGSFGKIKLHLSEKIVLQLGRSTITIKPV